MSTTSLLAEIPDEVHLRLLAYMRSHPNLDGDAIVTAALERHLALEDSPSVEIPVDLLTDLLQACVWVQMFADCSLSLDSKTVQTLAEQANKVELWAREYHIKSATPAVEIRLDCWQQDIDQTSP